MIKVYCLSVGTYMDANGDGIGDFQGLMRRLDYIDGLEVSAIWLMPFQEAPGRDTVTTSPTTTASIRLTVHLGISSSSLTHSRTTQPHSLELTCGVRRSARSMRGGEIG
jgi:hypothetical protein